jgi:hypothetical protein
MRVRARTSIVVQGKRRRIPGRSLAGVQWHRRRPTSTRATAVGGTAASRASEKGTRERERGFFFLKLER